MYTERNFKTKKELKFAVEKWKKGEGQPVRYFQPGPFAGKETQTGEIYVEGPHYPEAHKWYARCKCVDGVIVGVK